MWHAYDDWLAPNYLEELTGCLQANPDCTLACPTVDRLAADGNLMRRVEFPSVLPPARTRAREIPPGPPRACLDIRLVPNRSAAPGAAAGGVVRLGVGCGSRRSRLFHCQRPHLRNGPHHFLQPEAWTFGRALRAGDKDRPLSIHRKVCLVSSQDLDVQPAVPVRKARMCRSVAQGMRCQRPAAVLS